MQPNGLRRFRTLFLFIAGKNGKSWLSALIAVYQLIHGGKNANIISIAQSVQQAGVIFDIALGIVKEAGLTSESGGPLVVSTYHRHMRNTSNDSKYKIRTSKPDTLDGEIVDVCLFDELHRVSHASELWRIINKGMGNKREPLLICTTTAGFDKSSYCHQKYDQCKRLISGELQSDTVLPYVYELPVDRDIFDEDNWFMANPATLGDDPFLSMSVLREAAEDAKRNPVDEMTFRRFHCNQFTDAECSWINMRVWDECVETFVEADTHGKQAFGGLDYAPINDLSAFVLAVPIDGVYNLICRVWLPEDGIERKCDHDGIDYLAWVRDGHMKLTPGDTTNLEQISNEIQEMCKLWQVTEIAADPFNTVELIRRFNEVGITTFANNNTHALMNYPCQQTMRAIMEGRIRHNANPILRHCASNLVVHMDHGQRIKPDKKKSTSKTDAMVATILAIGRAELQAEDQLDAAAYYKGAIKWAG